MISFWWNYGHKKSRPWVKPDQRESWPWGKYGQKKLYPGLSLLDECYEPWSKLIKKVLIQVKCIQKSIILWPIRWTVCLDKSWSKQWGIIFTCWYFYFPHLDELVFNFLEKLIFPHSETSVLNFSTQEKKYWYRVFPCREICREVSHLEK